MPQHGYERYERFIERFLKGYIHSLQVNYPAIFQLEEYCVASSVKEVLRLRAEMWGWPALYHSFCEEKKFIRTINTYFRNMLDEIYNERMVEQSRKPRIALREYKIYSALKPYRRRVLLYLYEKQQLDCFDNLFNNLKYPLLLVTHFPLPADCCFSSKVASLFVEEIEERCYKNTFVDRCFPCVSATYNRFDIICRIAKPSLILVGEGGFGPERVWAEVGKRYDVPTAGISPACLLPQTVTKSGLYDYSFTFIDEEEGNVKRLEEFIKRITYR